MKVKYDLHIHTALSPCALEEMSPNNIYNMSLINELNVIAITDHNSCGNVEPILELAQGSELVVIPGMEVETKEEIHVVCLFTDISRVYKMQDLVYASLPPMKNKPKVLGHQLLFDIEDEVVGEEDKLLSFATGLSYEEVVEEAWKLGGIAIPAHIDRPSYSVISNLGLLPENDKVNVLEVSQYAEFDNYIEKYGEHLLLQSSDSHELGFIGICKRVLEIPVEGSQLDAEQFIGFLRSKSN